MNTKTKRIYLSSPHMSGHEMGYINEAFTENWIAPLGHNDDLFEKALEDNMCKSHVAALSSGTAALHLALLLLGTGPGDIVVVQSFTFSATVNPVVYCGATPVFVDSEPDTWNMDPDLLEEAIIKCQRGDIVAASGSAGPARIRAIIPVHRYGMPANMEKISDISLRYGIPVIEDAAEALGSRYKGLPAGSFGEMGVLSFNGNKIITTSGGGALVSDNEAYVKKARFLATQARDDAPHYQHSEIGYNYRMSNIVAGIGRGQMEVIEERVRTRRENFVFYRDNLSGFEGVMVNEEPGPEYFSNRWLTTILIDPEQAGCDRERLRKELEKENIESRPLWKPMHLQPVFRKYPALVNGVSEGLFERGLCLPSGSNLTGEDRERIMNCLLENLQRG